MHRTLSLRDPRAARAFAAFACFAAASGCAQPSLDATAAAAEKLSPSATAYVAVPENGRFGTRVYSGSGRKVATLVADALSSHLHRVEIADGELPPQASLAEARAGGFTYLIRPSILRWEDHPAAWSGGLDQAKILMEVIDVGTGNAADVAVVEAQSGEGTSRAEARETPGDALEVPLRAYAARLLPAPAVAAQK